MKIKIVRVIMGLGLIFLVNYENQSVVAQTSEATESIPLNENETNEEIEEAVPENKLAVSDKLLIEPVKPHAGEQLVFSLNLPEETVFETIVLRYLSSETNVETDVALTYDSDTKRYEGKLDTDSGTDSGIWQFVKAVGIDENNGVILLETILLTEDDVGVKQGDFEVLPHPSSLLDLSSIKVEPKAVKVGEMLQFDMKAVENRVLTDVTVVYRSMPAEEENAHQQLTLSLTYNEETNGYEGGFAAITPDLVGDWVIDSISAADDKGNPFILYNRFFIDSDKKILQEQLDELNKQLNEEQTVAETEELDNQEKIDALEEKIQQLEESIEAKEKRLQADLSFGDFTIEENLAEEVPDKIDEETPAKTEEEGVSEPESNSSLTESAAVVSQEEKVVELDEDQKKEDTTNDESEKASLVDASDQGGEKASISDNSATEEETGATEFSKGSLLIVVVAFVIINGFIFKF